MNELQKCAEILVECGYAYECYERENQGWLIQHEKGMRMAYPVKPYMDTLEGRRQADAIEDWLVSNYVTCERNLWEESKNPSNHNKPQHQWRLDRIKWCIEQLINKPN